MKHVEVVSSTYWEVCLEFKFFAEITCLFFTKLFFGGDAIIYTFTHISINNILDISLIFGKSTKGASTCVVEALTNSVISVQISQFSTVLFVHYSITVQYLASVVVCKGWWEYTSIGNPKINKHQVNIIQSDIIIEKWNNQQSNKIPS